MIYSFSSSPTTYCFKDSATLRHTTFAMFRNSQVQISTCDTCISNVFDGSLESRATDKFDRSASLAKELVSSSVRDIRKSEGGNTDRMVSLVIASFVLLVIAGVAIVAMFRRQAALLTDSDTTTPSNSVTETTRCPPTGNRLSSLAPDSDGPPAAPMAHPTEPAAAPRNQVTEGNARISTENEFDLESTFPESQYREADLLE
jgi:hypothetical protein